MSDPALTLLRSIDRRLARLEGALAAGPANDDGWARLPATGGRCSVSNWSTMTLRRKIKAGLVRSKIVGGSRFYAAAVVLALISQPTTPTP
jgi:hypothetical protein